MNKNQSLSKPTTRASNRILGSLGSAKDLFQRTPSPLPPTNHFIDASPSQSSPPFTNKDSSTPVNTTNNIRPSTINKQTMEAITLMEYATHIIPEFSGNPDLLKKFIDSCSRIMEQVKTPDDTKTALDAIFCKLTGDAYELCSFHRPKNWTETKNLLEKNYGKTYSLDELENDITNLNFNPNKQSIQEYIIQTSKLFYRYANILKEHGVKNIDEAKSLADLKLTKHFILGLPNPIYTYIRSRSYRNLDECLEATSKEYILEEALRHTPNQQRKSQTSDHSNTPPYNEDLRQPRYTQPYLNEIIHQQNRSHSFQPLNSYDLPRTRQRNFTPQQLFCNYCKRPNHTTYNCQKKAESDKRRYRNTNTFQNQRFTGNYSNQGYSNYNRRDSNNYQHNRSSQNPPRLAIEPPPSTQHHDRLPDDLTRSMQRLDLNKPTSSNEPGPRNNFFSNHRVNYIDTENYEGLIELEENQHE